MKKFLVSLTALLLFLASAAALADRDRGWGKGRGFDRDHGSWGWRGNNGRRDHDHVSVSIGLGSGWTYGYPGYGWNSWNRINSGFGLGIGYSTFGYSTFGRSGFDSFGTWGYNARRPVVIQHNTVIERPVTRTVETRYLSRPAGTSLLRELSGRCVERSYDSQGREIRIELPASACNF